MYCNRRVQHICLYPWQTLFCCISFPTTANLYEAVVLCHIFKKWLGVDFQGAILSKVQEKMLPCIECTSHMAHHATCQMPHSSTWYNLSPLWWLCDRGCLSQSALRDESVGGQRKGVYSGHRTNVVQRNESLFIQPFWLRLTSLDQDPELRASAATACSRHYAKINIRIGTWRSVTWKTIAHRCMSVVLFAPKTVRYGSLWCFVPLTFVWHAPGSMQSARIWAARLARWGRAVVLAAACCLIL